MSVGVEVSTHPADGGVDDRGGSGVVGLGGRGRREAVEDVGATRAAGADEEAVATGVEQLGQCEVEPLARVRPGVHGGAEAGAAGVAAGDRDDERWPRVGRCSGRRLHRAVAQHAVVDGDGVQVARPHAEQRERRRLVGGRGLSVGAGAAEPLAGGEQQRLPRLRADDEAEEGVVTAVAQSVAGAVLLVADAAREVVDPGDRSRGDDAVMDGRPHHGPAVAAQEVEQRLQAVGAENRGRWGSHREHLRIGAYPRFLRLDCPRLGPNGTFDH